MTVKTSIPMGLIIEWAVEQASEETGFDISPKHLGSVEIIKKGKSLQFTFDVSDIEDNENQEKSDVRDLIIPFDEVVRWNKDRIDNVMKKTKEDDVSNKRET